VIAPIATAILFALLTGGLSSQSAQSAKRPQTAKPDRAALMQQAAEAHQAGRFSDAVRLLRVAAETHQSVTAYLELARLQSRMKQPSDALATLAKARELAPNSEDVLSAYAQLALATKQPMPAVLTLQALTRMCPAVAQYHYLLGVGLMAIGDIPGAVEALVEADRLEPERAITLLALGLALNNRQEYARAKSVLRRSVDLQPEGVEAIAALAEAEAGLGDFDEAARHAQRALERAPAGATANLVMGLVLMERRNYAGARDALLKAVAGDPDSPKAPYQLSLVYARLGDDANSRRYLEAYRENLRGVEERIKLLRAGGSLADTGVRR
jgi:tetratricopeptide (TPR) repeat protein